MVWVELLYHEILPFPIRCDEEEDGSILTEVAGRLCILQGLLLDNKRYHESFEFMRLRTEAVLDEVEIIHIVSEFMTAVRTDWASAYSHFIRAKAALSATAYRAATKEITDARRYFSQCGNEIGLANCLLLQASIPDSTQVDALLVLQQEYKRLSYPRGMVSCLRAQANKFLEQRQFEAHRKICGQLLELDEECGSQFGWCRHQFLLLVVAAFETRNYGAINGGWLALLHKLEIENFQTPSLISECCIAFSLFLMDVKDFPEAVRWAEAGVNFDNQDRNMPGLKMLQKRSDAMFQLALAIEGHRDIPDDRYQAALDDMRVKLEEWIQVDEKNGWFQQQIDKCLVVARFFTKLTARVEKDTAYAKAMEWISKSRKMVPLMVEDKREVTYGDIAFAEAGIHEHFEDWDKDFDSLVIARDHLTQMKLPRVVRIHQRIGLNRLLLANVERIKGEFDLEYAKKLLDEARDAFYMELATLQQWGTLSRIATCYYNIAVVLQSSYELGQNDALLKALESIEKSQEIRDELRYEFSVLSGPENLARKHALVASGQPMISLGLQLYHAKRDAEGMWMWIQKTKARSLLDIMGVGVIVPAMVTEQLLHLPEVQQLLDKERALFEAIQQASPVKRYEHRRQFEEVQQAMRGRPELQYLLSLRGMLPVDTKSMMQPLEGREHVVFVDWASCEEQLILIIARPPSNFQIHDVVGFTVSDVAAWKINNLRFLDEGEECLRQLDVLVAHLAESTTSEDLLILSPTGPLHGLPLHALLIGDQILLERNRFVYSPSMSILHQCMNRSTPKQDWNAAIFGNPTNDRPQGAASAKELGSLFHSKARIGKDADLASFCDLAPSANLIHYHGHARFDSQNPLQSALILAEKRNLTAHDIFALPIVASLVVLIACSSGVQRIHPGDEPVGLTSAFLCAGARAVVGTLWPVQDAYAKEFSELFYKGFVSGGTIDLARVLQTAVTEMRNRHSEPECWAPFFIQGDWVLKDVPVFHTEN